MSNKDVGADVKTKIASLYFDILKELGAKPEYDDDGDVKFDSLSGSGLTFIAIVDGGHEEFVRICLPTIYQVKNPDEKFIVLEACNYSNLSSKAAKIYMNKSETFVWVAYEAIVSEVSRNTIRDAIETASPILEAAALRFLSKMQELR